MFERLPYFLPEEDIIQGLLRERDQLWGAIVKDLQKVLSTGQPTAYESPQFRVADFARIGFRISKALSIEDSFIAAIESVHKSQKTFSLDEEQLLVTAIQNSIRRQRSSAFMAMSSVWTELELCSPDALTFSRMYHNAVQLGKKLWAMHASLKTIVDIEWRIGEDGTRQWKFAAKE
jgi:hypothetical protein